MMSSRHFELLFYSLHYIHNLFVKIHLLKIVKPFINPFFEITYINQALLEQPEILSLVGFLSQLTGGASHQRNKLIYCIVHRVTCKYFE